MFGSQNPTRITRIYKNNKVKMLRNKLDFDTTFQSISITKFDNWRKKWKSLEIRHYDLSNNTLFGPNGG